MRSRIRGLSAIAAVVFAGCAVWKASHAADVRPLSAPDPTESRFCASCHPAIYAEHVQNTHGRAFFDGEARLATRGFRREDCIRCHTPRPVAETGIGRTPIARWSNLEEGNTCLSCHAKADHDYARFVGGKECTTAFEPRVGTVQDCATCHRIAGTPDQWSRAENGNLAGNECLDCHMPLVKRPVAVGEPPRPVRSHVFPASRSDSQIRKAYDYEASIEGNEVVVEITNKGAGHNFPTANRQRAVESLVVVRDEDGNEVTRSRMVCHYPYASELAPHQLTMPTSSQIPSGKTREHRVPLGIVAGTVECRLYFKLYRPIADEHPTLSRRLEERRLAFSDITPSEKPVSEVAEAGAPIPETDLNDYFSTSGLSNIARPAPGTKEVAIPTGSGEADIRRLVALLESHLPEARARAKDRLVEIGPPAYPALVQALGHWSNETFNEAKSVFVRIGDPGAPTLVAALSSDDLYVRCHAREILERLGFPGDRAATLAALTKAVSAQNPIDRRSAAAALGRLGDASAKALLRPLVDDPDPDVVSAASTALARLGDRDAVPGIVRALGLARYSETRRDLAVALADLGSPAGIPSLLDGLDDPDPLVRAHFFESLFAVTGVHLGYEPEAPEGERLEAVARLAAWWEKSGGPAALHATHVEDPALREHAFELVEALGGGTDTHPSGDDRLILEELVAIGDGAVPALVEGLTFPSGFSEKRALVCQALGDIGDARAAPFLAATLRDPVVEVVEWALLALERIRDPSVLGQVRRLQDRIGILTGVGPSADDPSPADRVLARAAKTRLALDDASARVELENLLLSESSAARGIAIGALIEEFGEDRGYDPNASPPERRAAASRWRE
jgi:HEAT repeat protein